MYNQYALLLKNRDHLVFVIALIFSFFLLLNNDNPRMAIVRGKSTEFVSFLTSPFTWVKSMMYLEEENQLLREINLSLTLQVESMLNLEKENLELNEMLDFKSKSNLKILPARVVNKGMQPNLLSIIIDAGSNENVMPNQPVLTAKGVIGKTIQSGETASIVQLITDINYRLSVRILPSGATGILRWVGDGKGKVREVQKNVEINIGDKVITSGFSDIYPAGLPVGLVSGVFDERGSYQKDVIVNLPTDLNAFQYAFVVINRSNEFE
ncbi:MAG: rod shape-determining protein MreC [Candidatus Marinimicrobia bacterium]|nr:rod shape-determining protein MreC [Candidatus Neomarinimicrobiota bacterium]|tara:strand:- start:2322 stop:3122 length:801 start_codon:yes stop_codon:yes gene_type:complete